MTGAEDSETRAAIGLVVRQIEANPGADPEPLAAAIVAALRGAGWRPTPARPSPDWRHRPAGRPPPPEFREALAAIKARAGVVRGEVIPERPAIEPPRQEAGAPERQEGTPDDHGPRRERPGGDGPRERAEGGQ